MEDESHRRQQALKTIAKANEVLADLHRQRFRTMMSSCLPAYDALASPARDARPAGRFELDTIALYMLAGAADASEFADPTTAFELELAASTFATQLLLHRKRVERKFDVFVSYHSRDREEVRTIVQYLEKAGLLPWLDERELRAGEAWQERLNQDLKSIEACAVVVGPHGIGPWQNIEVQSAIQLFVERRRPVVPVILPSVSSLPELPLFLRSFGHVDFRTLSPDPISRLVRAIAGDTDDDTDA